MSTPSTADRFIELMAAIKALTTDGIDDPMRHAVRQCKDNANMILDDAINQAWGLVEIGRNIPKDCADAVAEAKKGGAE